MFHAFADQFIVVGGTVGSSEEKRIQNREIEKFKKLWKTNYYGEFRYKNDIDITKSDIRNSHLILIGNQNTNLLLKRIIKKIPLSIRSDKITIGRKVYEGDKINFHMIYPNPLNSNKYIVIVSTNNYQYYNFGNMDLSTSGWYDFGIWNIDQNSFVLQDAGYYDRCWE